MLAALMLIGAGVALHVAEAQDLPLEDRARLVARLSSAIQTHAGVRPFQDPLLECADDMACVGLLLERANASDVVIVRAFRGPRRVRVVLARYEVAVLAPREAKVDLASDGEWIFDDAVRTLFPDPIAVAVDPVPPPEPPRSSGGIGWASIAVYGVAIASGGTAIGFGLASQSSRQRIEDQDFTAEEYPELVRGMRRNGNVANVLFGVAAASLVTGVIVMVIEGI